MRFFVHAAHTVLLAAFLASTSLAQQPGSTQAAAAAGKPDAVTQALEQAAQQLREQGEALRQLREQLATQGREIDALRGLQRPGGLE